MITECGIFGIINKHSLDNNIIQQTISGLDLLQHRGRESAGISCVHDNKIHVYKDNGLVKDIFKDFSYLEVTSSVIGHVRYSTSGKNMDQSDLKSDHLQPFTANICNTPFAMVYNGNIKNIHRAIDKFNISSDVVNSLSIDTKLIVEILKSIDKPTLREKLIEFMKSVNGVYCLLIMTTEGIYCLRDSYGVRPLCIGKSDDGGFCVSSESCALQDYKFIREVNPGEILFIDDKINNVFSLKRENTQKCIFEYIYFMNKDTRTNHKIIEDVRYKVGSNIADNDTANGIFFDKDNTYVTGCPITGIPYGHGYAERLGLKYIQFLRKTAGCGRTFILPENDSRIITCKKNLYISTEVDISGRNLILLDDSLVRGNTMRVVIEKLREQGAKSVHVRITSPPVRFPCYFGVDIPSREELIASNNTLEQVRCAIGADTLVYTDLDIIKNAIGEKPTGFCGACFDGQYKKELLDW